VGPNWKARHQQAAKQDNINNRILPTSLATDCACFLKTESQCIKFINFKSWFSGARQYETHRTSTTSFHIQMAEYTYQPLPDTGQPLRLLTLLPADNREADIQCHMAIADLNEDPSYLALSYCWGEATKAVPILLNGAKFLITKSLAIALQYLRQHFGQERAVVVWADALCINQYDQPERSSQVQIMGEIFSSACQVVLWLGEEKDDSDLAMDLIQAMGTRSFSLHDIGSWETFLDMFGLKSWRGLDAWARRPAWARIWILQEFVLGRELLLMCGTKSVEWPILEEAQKRWIHDICQQAEHKIFEGGNNRELWDEIAYCAWSRLRDWCALRKSVRHHETKKDLFDVLVSFETLNATDSRDMIYGLLGVSRHRITASYAEPTNVVYVRFATDSISQGSLSMLYCAGSGIAQACRRSCTVPSWVPDWHLAETGYPRYRFLQLSAIYNACVSSPEIGPALAYRVGRTTSSLFVEAVTCQIVRQCFKNSDDAGGSDVDHAWSPTWVQWAVNNAGTPYAKNGMPILQALFRTLLLDNTRDYMAPSDNVTRLDDAGALFAELALGFLIFLNMENSPAFKNLDRKWNISRPEEFEYATEMLWENSPNTKSNTGCRFEEMFLGSMSLQIPSPPVERGAYFLVNQFTVKAYTSTFRQAVFITDDGHLGVGPEFCRETDIVCAILGMKTLAMMRKHENYWEYVGPCFMLGFMDGEVLQGVEDGTLKFETIEIR
jgi:Heterokaryon incompatibility protein (HET)